MRYTGHPGAPLLRSTVPAMSPQLDWEKANTKDRAKRHLAADAKKARKRRAGHSGRQPSPRQLSFATHLAGRFETDQGTADCCTRHLSQWITGCLALADEGFYQTRTTEEADQASP